MIRALKTLFMHLLLSYTLRKLSHLLVDAFFSRAAHSTVIDLPSRGLDASNNTRLRLRISIYRSALT